MSSSLFLYNQLEMKQKIIGVTGKFSQIADILTYLPGSLQKH